ncbi:hypothetical protein OG897_07725 [Streptomyces sp. NBC_00237]|uniref:hypothetical protein n=1 Tax=Streptomyces sp. NBC_00237 TaxID=2975687 RepID=UPI00225172B4|nr:hypothetical protein [Streptomyces sp. NBC_00237]MCX5201343.1 hypothetical protein [Streptomyces sp. NBC_00237]
MSTPHVGDGNNWVEGLCWLYCRREGVPVLWIGPVHVTDATGHMYGCETCMAELRHMVHADVRRRDQCALQVGG